MYFVSGISRIAAPKVSDMQTLTSRTVKKALNEIVRGKCQTVETVVI